MPTTNYPYGLSSFGVPVLPEVIPAGIGAGFGGTGTSAIPGQSNVYFVNSAVVGASDVVDGMHGLSPQTPFKTLNFALTKTIANNGDVVYCGAGHVETVSAAAGLTIPTATAHGVTVYFLGNELDRAQINYTTSTAATVTIPANNVTLVGPRILNSIDARVDGLIITGADCKIIGAQFYDATGASSLISVRTTTAGTRLKMYDCRCYFAENTGTQRTEFIRIVGGGDHEIHNLYVDAAGNYSTAALNNVTTASTGILLRNCVIQNAAAQPAVIFVSTSAQVNIQTSVMWSAGASAVTLPSSPNFTVDYASSINANGSAQSVVVGSPLAFQKSFTSSSLTTSPQTFITCTGGSIIVEGITVETDATGLAGGTNHQLLTNNTNGLSLLAAETVANLGANKTIDLTAASVTAMKKGFVLESGKVLQLDNTVGAGTGAGTIKYNVYGRVLSGNPVLS